MSKPAPVISFVSLGCPKALVDSERILTHLRAEGYEIARRHDGADVVIVNTCGFLDSAKAESLDAIGTAMAENGRVIVTGCMGAEPEQIRDALSGRAVHHRPAAIRERRRGRPRGRTAGARSLRRPGAAAGHQADAAPLRLSEDFRRLQQSLQLLHHPEAARRSRLAPGRRRAPRGRAPGQGRRQGTPCHLAGYQRLRRRREVRGEPLAATARCAPSSSTSPASSARSASGSGSTTSTPTRMSTRSFR